MANDYGFLISMKATLNPPSQDASHPAAAVVSRFVGPNRLAQQQRAAVAFRMTESEAEKYGLGDRWRAAMKRRLEIASRKASVKAQLADVIGKLLAHAEAERLSQREMTRKAGLSWGTFRRCRDGRADPAIWFPKIQTALKRLTPS